MELKQLVQMQREFDERHGWTPEASDPEAVASFMVRDLIGMFGEMGEFANAVKKVQLTTGTDLERALNEQAPYLKEELVDFMIYVIRFAAYLDIDLEAEYLRKLSFNEERFQRFLRSNPERPSTNELT